MARETKVGLLAGLAFIICFAVILANRGANSPPGAASALLPNGGLELPQILQHQQVNAPNANVNQNNVARKLASNTSPSPSSGRTAQNPATPANPQLITSDAVPASGAQLPLNMQPQPPSPDSALAYNTRPVDPPSNPSAGLERALTSPSPAPTLQRTNTPVSMMATAPNDNQPGVIPTRGVQRETAGSQSASKPKEEGTPYTVKPSDTLSSIAAAHYSSKSKKAVEAIYEANRSVLPNMNSLKVGTVLTIPKLLTATPQKTQSPAKPQTDAKVALAADTTVEPKAKETEKSSAKKENAEKKSAKKTEQVTEVGKGGGNFKWYQVKKNDRFASIARDQLGDEGRWHEVYEMNKDKFPDPQHIREGVRIKLPAGEALASAAKNKEKIR